VLPGQSVLIVGRLRVRSTYGQNVEVPANDVFDPVQFYLPGADDAFYRIRTFALDHDIHVHKIGQPSDQREGFARAHLHHVYGDVLAAVDTITLRRMATQDLIDSGITTGELEVVAEAGYAFWNPDGAHYATRSEPAGPGERAGMAQVVYLGGVARFWLPDTWQIEMSEQEGGLFFNPDGDTALRLNVLVFNTSAATTPPRVRHVFKPGERAIDGGRLTTGHEFDVYETDEPDGGTRLRCWQIAQVLPDQCRIYLFSYAYAIDDEDAVADELRMVDREVRRVVPYPEPI
jgi:hypothetical protein